MKIKKLDRIERLHNPLTEVVVQVKFPRNMQIEQDLPANFQLQIADKFPHLNVQESQVLTFEVSGADGSGKIKNEKAPPIYQFKSGKKDSGVSLTSEFVALTTSNYQNWTEFKGTAIHVFDILKSVYTIPLVSRIGLRYRNVIDRKKYGLENVSWCDLIQPNLIGLLSLRGLFETETVDEKILKGARSITQVNLENYSLTAQAGFADIEGGFGFVIDNDFYLERDYKLLDFDIANVLEGLHEDAESTFRHFIKDKLYGALAGTGK
jgi:uncharacterized protein (TIGR04255 family)